MTPDPTTGDHAAEHHDAHDHALELLLAHHAHRAHGDNDGGADFPEALRRISADVARHRAGTYTPPAWWADHTRARLGLDSLTRTVLTGPKAVALLSRFADRNERDEHRVRVYFAVAEDDVDTEIDGARVFGCLLHLAGHPLSAGFWWKIAAGAGDRVSAFAIYLQHLQRGEHREAEWWFQEAVRGDTTDDGALPPGLPDMPGYFRVVPTVLGPWSTRENTQPAVALAAEVDRLVVRTNPGDAVLIDGIAARPGPRLATRLEELAGRH